jgi:hypothetical protein
MFLAEFLPLPCVNSHQKTPSKKKKQQQKTKKHKTRKEKKEKKREKKKVTLQRNHTKTSTRSHNT